MAAAWRRAPRPARSRGHRAPGSERERAHSAPVRPVRRRPEDGGQARGVRSRKPQQVRVAVRDRLGLARAARREEDHRDV
eukprot:3120995-Prymnesium_polylepis.2